MSDIDELMGAIFSGTNRGLYREFEGWVRGSRRFRAFATSYQTKIHAKLRNVRDAEGLADLRAELETAAILLSDERFALEYETYAALKRRGPDYTVTFRTHTAFNVEVRHIRSGDLDTTDAETRVAKLVAVVCDKVAQMPPSIANLLWLAPEQAMGEEEILAATGLIRQLVERKADPFFVQCGYASAAEFLKQYQRLSGIVVRQAGGLIVWLNPLARHPIPREVVNAVQRLG